jgi:serine/threonine protein kinase/WD40 repeat protein
MPSNNEKGDMDPQRWKQINKLLDAVIDLDPDKRLALLDHACAGDDRLRREVEALLSADERAGSFIELPVVDPAARYLSPRSDAPAVLYERQVVAGRYEILSRLGAGGMGEVWHAYDAKLRVDVALKTIRGLAGNQDPLEALRREVRIAREVISPNVCRIFDLISAEDQEFISMEYIDGMTLITMLQQNGPLKLSEARDIAAQFLSGLDAIHRAGLVHCDLKPENIMITRTGRVVVMDFGIAKKVMHTGIMISGTLPYMSPERLSEEPVDVRADLFSAGVILAEMIHPKRIDSKETREEIWNVIHKDCERLPDSPWKGVILCAIASDPDLRFPSAEALSRALEEATERVEKIEQSKPFPGLSSFRTADSEYFFGRELEVENLLKKLQQLHLMALIGPSGAGKTSLLRAGLIPALPEGRSYVFSQPGDAPLINLGQSLAPQFSGDTIQNLIGLKDIEVALSMLRQWRQNHAEAILIVDRFEELFTLNSPEVQGLFAGLIGQAVMEADVRVLLAMRDDFLILCREHSALAPIFSELTAMLPLTGAALRRTLVQPALKCGYRFEDEKLVDEIISDVEKERGALPLMAFAAARLWEKRDRTSGQLTRKSYKSIGGVAGALAQHAEETMERVGLKREPVVREIFRHLITAENTRIGRDIEEILSVFPAKAEGEEVLRILIDARLLTSFELQGSEGEKRKRRVEIIHESLLSVWPRLVRWQTQDADGAQLRDQLRQAAQLWEQKERSPDLLWTGTTFLEFQAWRQRQPGRLTSTEEAFAQAMEQRANRKRKQKKRIAFAIFVVLLSLLATVIGYWYRATVARDRAILEARKTEAGKLLVLGRTEAEGDTNYRLAWALASLELLDTSQAREFTVKALSTAPPSLVMNTPWPIAEIQFSPDGKWLLVGGVDGVKLLPQDGGAPLILSDHIGHPLRTPERPQFSSDGQFVIWSPGDDRTSVNVWSLSQRKVVRTFHLEGFTLTKTMGGKPLLITDTTRSLWNRTLGPGLVLVRSWKSSQDQPEIVARWNSEGSDAWDFDSSLRWVTYAKGHDVYIEALDGPEQGHKKLIGKHDAQVKEVHFSFGKNEIISADFNGEVRIWSLSTGAKNPVRSISAAEPGEGESWHQFWTDPSGTFLLISGGRKIFWWDLNAPDYIKPAILSHRDEEAGWIAFDKDRKWMAISWGATIGFYPLMHQYPYILGEITVGAAQFTNDGKSLVSFFFDDRTRIRIRNMPGDKQLPARKLWESDSFGAYSFDLDPMGRYALAATPYDGFHLISIADGKDRSLKGVLSGRVYQHIDCSADGGFAVAGPRGIEICDLQSGRTRILEKSKGVEFSSIRYAPDGSLFSGDTQGRLYHWNLKENSVKISPMGKGLVSGIAISNNGRYLATSTWSGKLSELGQGATSHVLLQDLKEGKSFLISSHGKHVFSITFDPAGTTLVTGDIEGIVGVGPINGDATHLLMGHKGIVGDVAVDPNAKWIASTDVSNAEVRLWPMPKGKPFTSLSYTEFLNRLRALTNVRAIPDKNSATGYRVIYTPFPGWQKVPSW